jgi:hypothetical protein
MNCMMCDESEQFEDNKMGGECVMCGMYEKCNVQNYYYYYYYSSGFYNPLAGFSLLIRDHTQ